ncbi:MAG: hypothetical protein ABSC60_01755 [Acidobacteriota bacterium]
MIYPPGQGRSGQFLMQLWRDYLEQYADKEGDVDGQTVVAAYSAVEVFAALSRTLDRTDRYRSLIDQRLSVFHEGVRHASDFRDCLINATFSIYNNLNTLSHQFTEGNADASTLIGGIDEQVRISAESAEPVQRSAAALRACFPLLSLISIALDQDRRMTAVVRQLEQRFAAGANAASSDWEHLLNALYRVVEMIQVFALLTDSDLKDQINQIATRFTEENQVKELPLKLRNGFCRLFELGHLLTTHVDALV